MHIGGDGDGDDDDNKEVNADVADDGVAADAVVGDDGDDKDDKDEDDDDNSDGGG